MKFLGVRVASATTILLSTVFVASSSASADQQPLIHHHLHAEYLSHGEGESGSNGEQNVFIIPGKETSKELTDNSESNDLITEPELNQQESPLLLFTQALEILKSISDSKSSSSSYNSSVAPSVLPSHAILTSSNVPLPLRARSGPSQIRRFIVQKLHWPKEKLREGISKILGPSLQEQIEFEAQAREVDEKQSEQKLAHAIDLLERSVNLGSEDSLYLLADMHFYGNYTCKRDFPKAVEYYEKLADQGNSTAQFMTGLAYSTGLFGTVEVDQAKASLYYTFAAYGGDVRAKMAMGFRHLAAIAGPSNYETAYAFYRSAADESLKYYLNDGVSGSLGRRHLGHNSFIIADEFYGGIYGQGASDVSSGNGPLRFSRRQLYGLGSIEGVLEFDEFVSDESIIVQFALAVLFYEGGIYSEPDYKRSISHALRGAGQLWDINNSDQQYIPGASTRLDKESIYFASRCAGFIGHRYLRGEGVEQNSTKALEWFRRGVLHEDPHSHDGLGLMYLRAIEVPRDIDLALHHLKAAAEKKMTSAQMNLARIYRAKGDTAKELEYITDAAQGHNLEAIYIYADHLISIKRIDNENDEGTNTSGRVYEESVLLLKQLSERVEDFHSPLRWAQKMYREGDLVSSLLGFLIAAEQGYESAQVNVAYILDESPGYIDLTKMIDSNGDRLKDIFPNSSHTSLVYWTRASKQINADAQVKMGDYYLQGIGTSVNAEKAAACYGAASDRGHGMASWNLGWMHENGIGHENDYHLAKRYYDHALASSPEAYLPVKLSLLQLHLKAYWNTLTGGKIRDIIPESRPKLSFKEHWELFWTRWKEMEFKLWDQDVEEYSFGGSDADWMDVEGDLMETLILLGMFASIVGVLWWRERRRRIAMEGGQHGVRVEVRAENQPGQANEPHEPSQPSRSTQPSRPDQPSLPSQPSPPSQPSQPSQNIQPSEPSQPSQPSQSIQSIPPSQPDQPQQPVPSVQPDQSDQLPLNRPLGANLAQAGEEENHFIVPM